MTSVIPVGSTSAALANECLLPAQGIKSTDGALLSDERPMKIRLTLLSGEVTIEGLRQEPRWLYPSLDALRQISRLPEGWDTYGGRPIGDLAIVGALKAIVQVLDPQNRELPPPIVVPTSEGGVQLEWHREGGDVEIRVFSSGKFAAFLYDARIDKEIELDPVDQVGFQRIAQFLSALWA